MPKRLLVAILSLNLLVMSYGTQTKAQYTIITKGQVSPYEGVLTSPDQFRLDQEKLRLYDYSKDRPSMPVLPNPGGEIKAFLGGAGVAFLASAVIYIIFLPH